MATETDLRAVRAAQAIGAPRFDRPTYCEDFSVLIRSRPYVFTRRRAVAVRGRARS